jgi:hypothetical protein
VLEEQEREEGRAETDEMRMDSTNAKRRRA